MYGSASLVQLRTSAALSLADSSLTWDSALCSSSLRSWRRWRLSAGSAYAGFRGARRPTRRIASRRTSLDSSLRVRNRARSASAWPRWPSATPEGRQKDANTARRTPASRSETAEASNRETMNASVAADQDAPKPGRAALFGPGTPGPVPRPPPSNSKPPAAAAPDFKLVDARALAAASRCSPSRLRTSSRRQHVSAASRRVAGSSSPRYSTTCPRTKPRSVDGSNGNVPRVRSARRTRRRRARRACASNGGPPEDPEPAEDPEPWREKCVDLLLEKPDSPETPPRADPYASAP